MGQTRQTEGEKGRTYLDLLKTHISRKSTVIMQKVGSFCIHVVV